MNPATATATTTTTTTTTAKIESIFSSPTASGTMISRPSATLIKGVGMDGDRYALTKGTYSCLKASLYNNSSTGTGDGESSSSSSSTQNKLLPEPGRQLTLISGDGVRKNLQTLEDSNQNNDNGDEDVHHQITTKSIGDFRRNVVLTGITSAELLSTVGCVLEFSSSSSSSSSSDMSSSLSPQVLVHRNCVPCMYNERKNQIPGLMEALWESGGVSCEIIRGGTISVGDDLKVVALPPPSPPADADKSSIDISASNSSKNEHQSPNLPLPYHSYRIDPGKQSSGFFVRPSKRTGAMVRESLQHQKSTYQQLIKVDPEGVERAASSYASVGLSFWPKLVHKNPT